MDNKKKPKNMETAPELAINQEAQEAFISAKAGGLITKKLVELAEKELMHKQGKK